MCACTFISSYVIIVGIANALPLPKNAQILALALALLPPSKMDIFLENTHHRNLKP